jgi:hypothetical protein
LEYASDWWRYHEHSKEQNPVVCRHSFYRDFTDKPQNDKEDSDGIRRDGVNVHVVRFRFVWQVAEVGLNLGGIWQQ